MILEGHLFIYYLFFFIHPLINGVGGCFGYLNTSIFFFLIKIDILFISIFFVTMEPSRISSSFHLFLFRHMDDNFGGCSRLLLGVCFDMYVLFLTTIHNYILKNDTKDSIGKFFCINIAC